MVAANRQVRRVHGETSARVDTGHAILSGAGLHVRGDRVGLRQLSATALHASRVQHVVLLPLQAAVASERDVRGRGTACHDDGQRRRRGRRGGVGDLVASGLPTLHSRPLQFSSQLVVVYAGHV